MSKQQTPSSHLAPYGRGGAGNIADASQSTILKPEDLETPTLKTSVVTTGRGGTGNMARNNDPHETRLRQDVEAVPRRAGTHAQHAGRGGAGNVFIGDEEVEAAQQLSDRKCAVDHGSDKSQKAEKTDEPVPTKGGWDSLARRRSCPLFISISSFRRRLTSFVFSWV